MKAHSKQSPIKRPVLTLIFGLAATIVSPALAQSPAELIPPAPDTYATGNAINATLGYGSAGQPLIIQNNVQNGTQNTVQNNAQNTLGYRVFIPSDNATIFEQAKAIEPTAFVQTIDGQRVIQVGLFGTEALALEQVNRFQAQGMPVRLQPSNQVPNAFTPTPSTIGNIAPAPFSTLPPTPSVTPSATPWNPATSAPSAYYPSQPSQIVNTVSSGYYVVIPTTNADVNYVQSQLNQLGIPPQYFFLRDRPFGLHYAIGSFSKRSEADRLTTIVRDRTKFDARVYHER